MPLSILQHIITNSNTLSCVAFDLIILNYDTCFDYVTLHWIHGLLFQNVAKFDRNVLCSDFCLYTIYYSNLIIFYQFSVMLIK